MTTHAPVVPNCGPRRWKPAGKSEERATATCLFRVWPLLRNSAQPHRDHEEDGNDGGNNASGQLDDETPHAWEEEHHHNKRQENMVLRHSKALNKDGGSPTTLRRDLGTVNPKDMAP